MVNLRLTDQFQLFSQFCEEIGFPDRPCLVEQTQIGQMGEGRYEVHAVCKTDILTYLSVHLFMNSFFDN